LIESSGSPIRSRRGFAICICDCRFVVPESPRWLAVNGKYDDVLQLLQKICRVNNKCLPKDFKPTCLLVEVKSSVTRSIALITIVKCNYLVAT